MATIKGPKGRMTKPIVTPYSVGDVVTVTVDNIDDKNGKRLHLGDTGVIRRIKISDPNDGDDTFLCFYVEWDKYGGIIDVGESEMTWFVAPEAEAWLRRQLAGLSVRGGAA